MSLEEIHKSRWDLLVGKSDYKFKEVKELPDGESVSTWQATNESKVTLTIKTSKHNGK